jgi:hypothetical protein
MHCDKHVPKMILESAQMLCTAYHESSPHKIEEVEKNCSKFYKAAYKNHPSTVWARESISHWIWLYYLGLFLCKEYTLRYGKTHASEGLIKAMGECPPDLPDGGFKEPPQCMPEEWKDESTVEAYRTYYFMDKSYFAKWTKGRPSPSWWGRT